nr:hypothetical protein [uncultured bacterium]
MIKNIEHFLTADPPVGRQGRSGAKKNPCVSAVDTLVTYYK